VIASVAPTLDGAPADLAALQALAAEPGVVADSGPFPYTKATVDVPGVATTAFAQGRGTGAAAVDQPMVTEGGWVRDGGVVVEAGFAEALGIGAGDRMSVGGRSFQVAGVAVTAASPPYPKQCFAPCFFGAAAQELPREAPPGAGPRLAGPPPASARAGAIWGGPPGPSGLLWLTDTDFGGLVSGPQDVGYAAYLRLDTPTAAPAFVADHLRGGDGEPSIAAWTDVLEGQSWLVQAQGFTLLLGAWLLGAVAVTSIAVLVGARMADQLRRVGLLKALGGTPGLVAAVLLAEYAFLALLAAGVGLVGGRLAAPLLARPGAGLIGPAGPPTVTPGTVAVVVAASVGIAAVSSLLPALRAARTSTVSALADAPRPPRRTAWLVGASARMPVPLLLGLRVAARRPRRTLLGIAAIAVTVTGIVALLATDANRHLEAAPGADPRIRLGQALLLVAVALVVQAAVNTACIAWSTALDTRHPAALARALGATPNQVGAGLAAAQVLPALAGALLGVLGGIGLAEVLDDDPVAVPAPWQLLAVVGGCGLLMALLTAVPARLEARRPVGAILQSERA
jgi:putative ABC transport system permease protein